MGPKIHVFCSSSIVLSLQNWLLAPEPHTCQNLNLCQCCSTVWDTGLVLSTLSTYLHFIFQKSAQMPAPFLQEPFSVCNPKAWVMYVPHSLAPTVFFPHPRHNTSPHAHNGLFCRGRSCPCCSPQDLQQLAKCFPHVVSFNKHLPDQCIKSIIEGGIPKACL